ncbi:DNA ligase [Ralstonia phage RSB2]|uniref:DNA ligase n=1 Tax=Ralstonia phage RSB2 TaxID=913183 RepID=E5RUZ7_9CAUD|nr:DNA ligase [Ralstonia phage RSB2]BAJ51805.1 DNA ligase-like protein [Ralstonia phage RSB2]
MPDLFALHGFHAYEPQGALKFNLRQITEALARNGLLYVGRKVDGIRGIIQVHKDGRVTITSRSSKVLPALKELVPPYLKETVRETFPDGIVLDCELSVKGRTFQEGGGDLRRKKAIDNKALIVWPIQSFNYDDIRAGRRSVLSFVQRRNNAQAVAEKLGALIGFGVADLRLQSLLDVDDIEPRFIEQREQGFEGLILYAPDALDRAGKVLGWWKVKPEDTIDGKVINWGEGTGKFAGITGFVTVEYEDGTVGDVGTFEGDEDATRRLTREQWIGRYVEVRYMERTDDGNLRHPVFVKFRDIEGEEGVKS